MYGTTYNQNNQAGVAQTFTRSALTPRVLFVNDTARSTGDRNSRSFASKSFTRQYGSASVAMVQANILWEYQLAADLAPFTVSTTVSLPASLQNNQVLARTRWQDFLVHMYGQDYGTNPKVDDLMAFRAWLP